MHLFAKIDAIDKEKKKGQDILKPCSTQKKFS